MIVRTMWGMRVGGSMPELMVAWDEYSIDSNSEGFENDCAKTKASWGSDLVSFRMIDLTVSERVVTETFAPTPAQTTAICVNRGAW